MVINTVKATNQTQSIMKVQDATTEELEMLRELYFERVSEARNALSNAENEFKEVVLEIWSRANNLRVGDKVKVRGVDADAEISRIYITYGTSVRVKYRKIKKDGSLYANENDLFFLDQVERI